MTDIGLILDVPVINFIQPDYAEGPLIFGKTRPLIDVCYGYSIANRGDKMVSYSGVVSRPDPLPRNATTGLSLEVGITQMILNEEWKILSFTIAREAEDILVERMIDGSTEYQSGFGDISFLTNVIGGKADSNGVNSKKGWGLNISEFVFIRSGSYAELPQNGGRNYSTSGYSFRLRGLLKLIEAMLPQTTSGAVLSYLRDHADIGFDHSDYKSPGSPLHGTSFDATILSFR
jgi:hypothetical protein